MRNSKYKKELLAVFSLLVLLGLLCIVFFSPQADKGLGIDHKNTTYVVDGDLVTLKDGFSETEAIPGSTSKVTTRHFGNDLTVDLNGDGRLDVVSILTQQTGASGTFFYVVASLNTEDGYIGSGAYLLGDRIVPQTTESSQNPNHKNVIVVNYVDRAPDEPMSTKPSVGKSVWLKLDPQSMMFGIVVQNFEGEADTSSNNKLIFDLKSGGIATFQI